MPFVDAAALEPGEDEAYLDLPTISGERRRLRALLPRDRPLADARRARPAADGHRRLERRHEPRRPRGARRERLDGILPVPRARRISCRLRRARRRRARSRATADYRGGCARRSKTRGWDGEWYRRAYYDDGTPLGSAQNDECQIDALAQAWAVLSGAAPRERPRRRMDAVERSSCRRDDGLIRLLDAALRQDAARPGLHQRLCARHPRERRAVHARGAVGGPALAELGRRERAAELLEMLTPIHHARTPAEVARLPGRALRRRRRRLRRGPHVGRGGWTWYTGSAGWMFRVAVESILGFGGRRELVLNPRIPATGRIHGALPLPPRHPARTRPITPPPPHREDTTLATPR